MKIVWSSGAEWDLRKITNVIAEERPGAAERMLVSLQGAVERLALFPMSGRIFPGQKRTDLREIVHRGFRVVYRIRSENVEVLAVRNARRELDPEEWSEQ